MTKKREREIVYWCQREFPYVKLTRNDAGFSVKGFRYREEQSAFAEQFARKFQSAYFASNPLVRLPSSYEISHR